MEGKRIFSAWNIGSVFLAFPGPGGKKL